MNNATDEHTKANPLATTVGGGHADAGTQASPSTPPYPPDDGTVMDTSQLLGSADQVKLRHGRDIYTLRRTRNGKLILTK